MNVIELPEETGFRLLGLTFTPSMDCGALRSDRLDLLDRVQKQVVSLVASGLSPDLQALSHRRVVASL